MSFEGPPSSIVNFLDIELNLTNFSYRPYTKPGNTLLYVDAQSNHPPNIIRNIPNMISNRISKQCSDSTIFNESRNMYIQALTSAGYKDIENKFKYKTETTPKNKSRKRNIIWYNPPFNKNVTSKIGGGL